ncbi:hypothetical protein SDC9_154300 [bioreactor metagenome]|uniref:Uncharacterized protein n=1 Tax=bioreactor metagenome TaxID=1076179 RepID=A0A645EYE6_9ZZZZ
MLRHPPRRLLRVGEQVGEGELRTGFPVVNLCGGQMIAAGYAGAERNCVIQADHPAAGVADV